MPNFEETPDNKPASASPSDIAAGCGKFAGSSRPALAGQS